MKKNITYKNEMEDELLPEYEFDFSKSKPNRFVQLLKKQANCIQLEPDIQKVFRNSDEVNNALRAVINAIPKHDNKKEVKRLIYYYILLISISILILSCSYKINRNGYSINEPLNKHCDVIILENKDIVMDSSIKKIGALELIDIDSRTEKARLILKQEACNANANLIIIRGAEFPGFGSPYFAPPRFICWADLFLIKQDNFKLLSDDKKNIENMGFNVKEYIDWKENLNVDNSYFKKTKKPTDKISLLHTTIRLSDEFDIWWGNHYFISKAVVLPYESILLENDDNPKMMKFFTVQLLITELFAKRLLKEIELKKIEEDDNIGLKNLFNKYIAECNKNIELYFKDTNYGKNFSKVNEWEANINTEFSK
ncbi:MAG: hypothetical protein V1779_03280 [bacterium]